MKINEITDKFKVMQSNPQGIEIASQNGTTIKLPPDQAASFIPNPQNPKSSLLNLNNASISQQPTLGQPAPGQPQAQQGTDQSAEQPVPTGQTAPTGQIAPAGQQPQLPKIGSEVELSDTIGSTMQTEKFDDSDLVKNGNKQIGGPSNGDKTDDLISDITDSKWEKHAKRSNRNVIQPVRESEELIAMLTIAGLR